MLYKSITRDKDSPPAKCWVKVENIQEFLITGG